MQTVEAIQASLEEGKVYLELIPEDLSLALELEQKLDQIEKKLGTAKLQVMLNKPEDHLGAVVSIHAGAGGTESCDWVSILLRMYLRWCADHDYKTEVTDYTDGDGAGYRSVTFTVEGKYAYGYLKAEVGIHRLVRISPFDANKRRHTSFAAFDVDPLVDDTIEIVINPVDIRIDTYRAGGKGGQNVQKNDTAVRMTHIPSGVVVQCQNERSQAQNKQSAYKILRSRLYALEIEKRNLARDAKEATKSDNAWGSQIRSYVLQPYRMIKDHRTDTEMGDTQRVLDGDLDPFIQAYLLGQKA